MNNRLVLKEIEIFKGLTQYELGLIENLATEEKFSAQQKIFEEGDPADKLYIVAEGEVEIKKWLKDRAKQISVDTVAPGRIFGWSALTEPPVLTAAAWATKSTNLLVFTGDQLKNLFRKNTKIGYIVMSRLACVISRRLRQTSEHLLEHLYGAKTTAIVNQG